MTVRLYEWDKNETGWAWIEITPNKVVNLILRNLNNLIKINDNNEVYVDLQLDDNLQSSSTIPVGVNVWRVLQANGFPVTGTLITAKTTSWDEVKVLYWDDGKIRVDNGTWEWKILAYEYNAWEWISIDTTYFNDRTKKFGNFHIPTSSEWQTLMDWSISALNYAEYLKIPLGGGSLNLSKGVRIGGTNSNLRCSDVRGEDAYWFSCGASSSSVFYSPRASGYSLRLFADTPVIPDETWTLLGTRNNAKIYRNEALWLITVSYGDSNYITLKDKNEGATVAYDYNGWPVNASNCGYFYQWGNCHGFPWSWATDTSSTKVDASGYWPYQYSGDTFITTEDDVGDRSSVQNDNLWAYEIPTQEEKTINNTWVLSVNWETGDVAIDTTPIIPVWDTLPSSPVEWTIFFNTTDRKLNIYDGTDWNEIQATQVQ